MIGTRADKNLAARRSVFEPRRQIYCVAYDRLITSIFGTDLARDNRPAVDPDMDLKLGSVSAINLGNDFHHFERSPQCALRVVLVPDWRAEQRHDFVADEFVDRAFVLLHNRDERLETGVHQRAHFFRIFFFRQRREPGDVGKDDGDNLAFVFGCWFLSYVRQLRELLAKRCNCRIDNAVAECPALRCELVDGSVVVVTAVNGCAVKVSKRIDDHSVIGKGAVWRPLERMNYGLGPLTAANRS